MNQPFIRHVGLHIAHSGEGSSELRLRIEAHHLNTNGVVHGGALFTLVDTGMGVALHSALASDERCATVDARISYFKPVHAGEVVCTSRLLHRSRQLAHLESTLTVDGVGIATASGTFAVFVAQPSHIARSGTHRAVADDSSAATCVAGHKTE